MGKVTQCDTVSDKVVLVQVPEHPIVSAMGEGEESAEEAITSLYAEDGSLEVLSYYCISVFFLVMNCISVVAFISCHNVKCCVIYVFTV